MLLPDSTAIVTGAASGIGRAIAVTFAKHGANVVVADLQERPKGQIEAPPTHTIINQETDSSAEFVECNVRSLEDIKTVINVANSLGELDILVNNAGVFNPVDFLETTPEQYDQTMEINARSMYFASQQSALEMMEKNTGSIINISSIAGYLGNGRFVKYAMSKGAVRMLTYSLADYLGPHGIRVNAIHPGSIDTGIVEDDDEELKQAEKLIPSGRIGQPEDVANVALFLASHLSDYVNGESILVDGGYTNTGAPRWDVKDIHS